MGPEVATLGICIHGPDDQVEATWGADPLEFLGGFHSLKYDRDAEFTSSLGTHGLVSWSHATSEHVSSCDFTPRFSNSEQKRFAIDLFIDFPNIDWRSSQLVYGWAALQWQGWIRGSLEVNGTEAQAILLNIENVLEFWVDDDHYFGGDYYAYQRQAVCLYLSPRSHQLDIRLVRDVRSMGGVGSPSLPIRVAAESVPQEVLIDHGHCNLPETVGGQPAGSYASIIVMNTSRSIAHILGIECADQNDIPNVVTIGCFPSNMRNILTGPEGPFVS